MDLTNSEVIYQRRDITTKFLRELYDSNLDRSEILITLTSASNVKSFICNPDLSNESASLLLHLCAVSVNCGSHAGPCIQLLSTLVDSPFLSRKGVKLLQYKGNTTVRPQYHPFACLIQDFIAILEQLFSRLPSSAVTPQIIGLVDLLGEQILQCKELKDSKMENVSRIKDEIIKCLKDRSKLKAKTKLADNSEDTLRPPDDFRGIPVIPRECDIFRNTEFLRRNKVEGRYMNLDHYLDVQFRLYREDFISPLRSAVKEYLQIKQTHQGRHIRLEDGKLYQNVKITEKSTSQEHGEVYHIKIDHEHSRNINWFTSKRLIFGSLACLSFDEFETVLFAVVTDSDRKTLELSCEFKAQIFISRKEQKIPKNINGIMIESSSAYFESYRHVLEALKSIHKELPFQRYIVNCDSDILLPEYLRLWDDTFDFIPNDVRIKIGETITPSAVERPSHILDVADWPSSEDLHLDTAQWEAFHAALTKEFVVIQGPPGTGKTHVGLQIAKILLHNQSKWNGGSPFGAQQSCMMIVCFSNHALDQFLQGILRFSKSPPLHSIVRLGSRSTNTEIENYTISKHRERLLSVHKGRKFGVLRDKHKVHTIIRLVNFLNNSIGYIKSILKRLQGYSVVLNFSTLQNVISERHQEEFGQLPDTLFHQWLQVTEEWWFQKVEKIYQGQVRFTNTDIPSRNIEGRKRDEYVDIVTEADYEYNQRYIENEWIERHQTSCSADIIGLDISKQLERNETINIEERCRQILRHEASKVMQNLRCGETITKATLEVITNLWELDLDDRWKIYRYWVSEYIKVQKNALSEKENLVNALFDEYKEAKLKLDEEIMQQASVIAMTTTGAARYHDSLSKIKPTITIIEEAAEVLEAHIVTALSSNCQHLILIGDHKQLEPKPAVYDLAVKYNLSISLFERMINNKLPYYCLQKQHRMRPEIAELVRHIYPVLQDSENVYEYSDIFGIRQNLFFLNHSNPETYKDDGRSFSNEFEAEYAKELCRYLINQGYKANEITILAAYSGQMYVIRNKMLKRDFEGVNITVVDNYQGEENEIIILSLVRSNDIGDIGFLSRENRICVALSRARKGLYILGNMDTLTKKSKHWEIINKKLELEDQRLSTANRCSRSFIGKDLLLYCQNHPEKPDIHVASPQDFMKVPDGGCGIPCEFILKCGHACRHKCHAFDKEHVKYECHRNCPKICPEGHKCNRTCHEPEGCNCPFLLEKNLPCGHTNFVHCHIKPSEHLCKTEVERVLPHCRHKVVMFCHKDVSKFECQEIITETRKKCSHTYTRKCHEPKINFEKQNKCLVKVEKVASACGHKKVVACHSDINRVQCKEVIVKHFKCGHSVETVCFLAKDEVCKDKCTQTCELGHLCGKTCHFPLSCECGEYIEKIMAGCNHRQHMPCCIDVRTTDCKTLVNKQIPRCGHSTIVECYKDPLNVTCEMKVLKQIPKCRHEQMISCSTNPNEPDVKCEVEVEVLLEKCGHTIKVNCWKMKSGIESLMCTALVPYIYPECRHGTELECHLKAAIERAKNSEDTSKGGNISKCRQNIQRQLLCGHVIMTECSAANINIKCSSHCNKQLLCGHFCMKTCIECLGGIIHNKCNQKCEKFQLCGHKCNHGYSCLSCKPCKKLCSYACEHNRCNMKCFDQCKPCRMTCAWECPHLKCSKLCSEICDRPKCSKSCKSILQCGHVCSGYCGEPCPEECIDCKPERFPLDANNQYFKFSVTLKECGHTFSAEYLDDYVRKFKDALLIKCPACNCIVHKHPRYDRVLKCKKQFIEEAKRKITDICESPRLTFPVFTDDAVVLIEEYIQKCVTYIHISKHLDPVGPFIQLLTDATRFVDNLQKVLSQVEANGFQTLVDLFEQTYKMYIYWILCVCAKRSDVFDSEFSIDLFPDIKQLFINKTAMYEEYEDDDLTSDYSDKRARPKVQSRPMRSIFGSDIIHLAKDMIDHSEFDHQLVSDLVSLLTNKVIEDAHILNAKSYPRHPQVMGIHEDEWKICLRGHVFSVAMEGTCSLCHFPQSSAAKTVEQQDTKLSKTPSQTDTAHDRILRKELNNFNAERSSQRHDNLNASNKAFGGTEIKKTETSRYTNDEGYTKTKPTPAKNKIDGVGKQLKQNGRGNFSGRKENFRDRRPPEKELSLGDFIRPSKNTPDAKRSRELSHEIQSQEGIIATRGVINHDDLREPDEFPSLPNTNSDGNLKFYRKNEEVSVSNTRKQRKQKKKNRAPNGL